MFVHGFQVKEKFSYLSFFRKHFFQIFQENFEIQDGRQRSHDHPIEKKKFQQSFFLHIAISIGHAIEVKKSIITLLIFL
jgi:hypothetical protein